MKILGFTDLRDLSPTVASACKARCQAKADESNAHFRRVAPGRFPDAKPCTYDGLACRGCIQEATP